MLFANTSSSLRGGEADEAIQRSDTPLWIASPRFAELAMTKLRVVLANDIFPIENACRCNRI